MAPAAPHVCRTVAAGARDTSLCAAAEPWHETHGRDGGAPAPLAAIKPGCRPVCWAAGAAD